MKKEAGKKSKKKKIILIVVVVVLVLVGLMVRAMYNAYITVQSQMSSMMEENDDLYTVERQDVEQEITTSGTVIGTVVDAYTSPVTAKVEDIKVEVGQLVQEGDVLLTYDVSELGDNLEKVKIQAQSEQAAGESSYEAADEAADKVTAAEKKVKQLKKEIKTVKAEIESLNDQITSYEDQLTEAETKNAQETERAATPKEDGTTEAPNLIDTKAITQQIRALNKELTKQNETLSNKQSKLAEQQSIVSANQDVKVSDSTKAQIDATNQLSNLSVQDAQESLDAAQAGITATGAGIVESVDIVQGAYATETQTLLTIIDADSIGVEFSISKDDLGSISEGQKARVVIAGNEYEGTVDYVSRVAVADTVVSTTSSSSGGTIKGRILLDNPDDNIYIGVAAKAYIFIGKAEQTLTIPYEALNTDVDGDFVYIVNDLNVIERRDVTVGICSDEYYQIIDGVQEGDAVIRSVTKDMQPGDTYVDGVVTE